MTKKFPKSRTVIRHPFPVKDTGDVENLRKLVLIFELSKITVQAVVYLVTLKFKSSPLEI